MRIVMLTGYASIATAVEAIKLGATQYLSKPANADEIVAAFGHNARIDIPLEAQPATVERVEWGTYPNACCTKTTTTSPLQRAIPKHAPPHFAAQTEQAAKYKILTMTLCMIKTNCAMFALIHMGWKSGGANYQNSEI